MYDGLQTAPDVARPPSFLERLSILEKQNADAFNRIGTLEARIATMERALGVETTTGFNR